MADEGTSVEETTAEVATATSWNPNPDAKEFRPGTQPSLVFGGGGHFLSKYAAPEEPNPAPARSGLRARRPDAGATAGAPDRVHVQLNQLIVHAGMPERILQIVDENFDQLNVVNLTTALHRLATVSLASKKASLRREQRFRRLVNRLSDMVRRADPATLKPQDLSNVAWGLTKLGIQNTILFNLLADRIVLRLESFKPVNLSMTLWAFARAGIYDEKLMLAASAEVKKQLKDFEPQQVANTAWAMAKCGHVDQELFMRAADQAIATLELYQPMNFSMLVYAFSLANLPHQELFEKVAQRCTVPALKHSFSAPNVVGNLALAYSEAQVFIPELFDVVAKVSEDTIHDFKPRQLVTLATSFSKAEVKKESLFKSMSKQVAKNVTDYQQEELQDLFKAFDALGISKTEIERAVVQENGSATAISLRSLLLIVILILITVFVWRI